MVDRKFAQACGGRTDLSTRDPAQCGSVPRGLPPAPGSIARQAAAIARYDVQMLDLAKRGSAGTASGVDALLSAVVFGGLAAFLPGARQPHASQPDPGHRSQLAAPKRRGCRRLGAHFWGRLCGPCCSRSVPWFGLCGLGGLAAWRFRAVLPEGPGLTADDAPFQLLAGVVWLVGATALLPRWLELSGVATDAYPALLLSALRGLLWLCTMAAILRAVLASTLKAGASLGADRRSGGA